MKINGFKIKYSAADIKKRITQQMRKIELIDREHESYKNLSAGDKKALKYKPDYVLKKSNGHLS